MLALLLIFHLLTFLFHNLYQIFQFPMTLLVHLFSLYGNISIFPNIWLSSCKIYLLWLPRVIVVEVEVVVKIAVMVIWFR